MWGFCTTWIDVSIEFVTLCIFKCLLKIGFPRLERSPWQQKKKGKAPDKESRISPMPGSCQATVKEHLPSARPCPGRRHRWVRFTLAESISHSVFGPPLCDPMGCSLPGSSAHGILQARILEWAAISFSGEERGDPTHGSNLDLQDCRWIRHCLSHQRSPSPWRVLTLPTEWTPT